MIKSFFTINARFDRLIKIRLRPSDLNTETDPIF